MHLVSSDRTLILVTVLIVVIHCVLEKRTSKRHKWNNYWREKYGPIRGSPWYNDNMDFPLSQSWSLSDHSLLSAVVWHRRKAWCALTVIGTGFESRMSLLFGRWALVSADDDEGLNSVLRCPADILETNWFPLLRAKCVDTTTDY